MRIKDIYTFMDIFMDSRMRGMTLHVCVISPCTRAPALLFCGVCAGPAVVLSAEVAFEVHLATGQQRQLQRAHLAVGGGGLAGLRPDCQAPAFRSRPRRAAGAAGPFRR